MFLALLISSALAAPPTQAEAHALVAGSALTLVDPTADDTAVAGVMLDYARFQGVLRHETNDGRRLGVQVQLEALNDPALLDALATYAPSDQVSVEVGLQRTWLSEMFDVLVPIQVLRGRTAPEGVAPDRRMGAQVVLGAREGRGTRAHVGVWAPAGSTVTRFQNGILSALVEHQTDSDVVLHGGLWATPDGQVAGSAWEQGFDAAVGYEPKGTRIVAEVAGRRSDTDWRTLGGTVYASHRLDQRKLEPAGFLDYRRISNGDGFAGGIAGARAGLTVHLVDQHAQWTTDIGASLPLSETGTLRATAGTRLMVAF
jgi:hypothetical protein